MSFIFQPVTVNTTSIMASQERLTATINPGSTYRFVIPTPFGLSSAGPGSIQIPGGQYLRVVYNLGAA
ncbi:MAG: hypothetical protein EBS53_06300 [Bacteroidetes bacterium]|nr:hypothetical protein [Bacteroidota bacterium]